MFDFFVPSNNANFTRATVRISAAQSFHPPSNWDHLHESVLGGNTSLKLLPRIILSFLLGVNLNNLSIAQPKACAHHVRSGQLHRSAHPPCCRVGRTNLRRQRTAGDCLEGELAGIRWDDDFLVSAMGRLDPVLGEKGHFDLVFELGVWPCGGLRPLEMSSWKLRNGYLFPRLCQIQWRFNHADPGTWRKGRCPCGCGAMGEVAPLEKFIVAAREDALQRIPQFLEVVIGRGDDDSHVLSKGSPTEGALQELRCGICCRRGIGMC